MAKLEQYRRAIQQLLKTYQTLGKSQPDIDRQIILDTEHDHYQLVNVGWHNDRRIYGCVLHFDIQDGKIWIQHNGTEFKLADELVALGVAKQDIVLGFQSPFKRQFTEFAVS
ncbi:MAG: XisI protein [Verrucomicrobia bacterium]|nr:XisI protein [Leptolyngbya sp. ES-bin-22]